MADALHSIVFAAGLDWRSLFKHRFFL